MPQYEICVVGLSCASRRWHQTFQDSTAELRRNVLNVWGLFGYFSTPVGRCSTIHWPPLCVLIHRRRATNKSCMTWGAIKWQGLLGIKIKPLTQTALICGLFSNGMPQGYANNEMILVSRLCNKIVVPKISVHHSALNPKFDAVCPAKTAEEMDIFECLEEVS